MYERVETEHKIHGGIGNHRQRAAIVKVAAHTRLSREPLTTRFDTFVGGVNNPEFLAIILEIMRPPPKAGGYLQNRPSRQAISNTGKDGTRPLRGRSPPRLGPLLACIFPIVLR